ncbi:MAG: glucosyltransferase domain-containing protein [Aestuariivirga sp.]
MTVFQDIERLRARLDEHAPGFVFLLVLSLLYALPLFFDGRYYLDDMPHAMNGLTLWEQDGRPLASIVSSLASFQWPSFTSAALLDISPLPQILGLAALAYAGVRLARVLFDAPPTTWTCLVVFPLIASPFMLQNLSYKYDALTMGLAVMLAVLASLPSLSGWRAILLGAVQLLAALLLYQAAANMFVAGTALLRIAFTWNREEGFQRLIVTNIAKLALALAAYFIIIKLSGGLGSDYAASHSKLIPLDASALSAILFNFQFGNFFVSEFISDAPLLALAAAAAILIFSVRLILNGAACTPATRTIIALLGLVVLVGSIMGILLMLAQPVVRPRTLMALSMLLIYASFAFHELLRGQQMIMRAGLVLATAWYFTLAYSIANAAHDQTRLDNYLAASIMSDLQQQGFKPNDRLAFDGTQPRSPAAENASRSKLIARTLQMNMNGNSEWGFRLLESFGLKSTPVTDADETFLKQACAADPAAKALQYQIFKQDQLFTVSFPGGVCFRP